MLNCIWLPRTGNDGAAQGFRFFEISYQGSLMRSFPQVHSKILLRWAWVLENKSDVIIFLFVCLMRLKMLALTVFVYLVYYPARLEVADREWSALLQKHIWVSPFRAIQRKMCTPNPHASLKVESLLTGSKWMVWFIKIHRHRHRHMRAGSIRLCNKEKKSDIYRHRRRFMFLIYFCCS